jgi:adenine-specific DNA methylase
MATITCLAFALNRQADFTSSLASWWSGGEKIQHTFTRQAIPIVWDFVECNPFSSSTGSWGGAYNWGAELCEHGSQSLQYSGKIFLNSAINMPYPENSIDLFFTDPPYYDAVPYADLSDFFYVWAKRTIGEFYPELLSEELTPKNDECIVDEVKGKDKQYFENTMKCSMAEGHKVLMPSGIGVIVFAHKSTTGWEAQLQAMIDAGWTITASWPIDTEMGSRLRAQNSAALASSIHLVCRPREKHEGFFHANEIGEWSDVLVELPIRIHEWMPRLAMEGVVGADAIFACLGPALEIFSRYSRVEKASGEQVTLKEYLEKVWEAVEKEALTMIFEGADASGFEEDARLTAMWLWTLKGGANGESTSGKDTDNIESESNEDQNVKEKSIKTAGYALEYDAARKIAQGLGAHPEAMQTLIEINKGNARLISVAERAPYLFGKQELTPQRKPRKRDSQLTLFPGEVTPEESISANTLGELAGIGKTNLDRVHQSMLLFGNGQSEELKKFLVEDGIGKDQQFKKLAQALVALYPSGSDEKRWAEGVMSRMKGLGL